KSTACHNARRTAGFCSAGTDELNHIVNTAVLGTVFTVSELSLSRPGSWSSGMPHTTSASPVRSEVSRDASSGMVLTTTLSSFAGVPENLSLRTSSTTSPGVNLLTVNGPEPTGCSKNAVSSGFTPDGITKNWVSLPGTDASGFGALITTSVSDFAVIV